MAGSNIIKTSAPGKLMLFGEHAVLYGQPCIVAAVTPRAHVTLTPRTDDRVYIDSELGSYQGRLGDIAIEPPFTFVHAAILKMNPDYGFDLHIACEFPPDVGLGSSGAITVAVVAALCVHKTGARPELQCVFDESLKVVHKVQGTGSGADLAASTFGGVLYLESGGQNLHKLNCFPDLVAVYSGSKEKTAVVIEKVRMAASLQPDKYNGIFTDIGEIVKGASSAFQCNDWEMVGKLMGENQRLMVEMGVSNEALERIISSLNSEDGIYGAKISGSGLGDCVWGLGRLDESTSLRPLHLACDCNGLLIN